MSVTRIVFSALWFILSLSTPAWAGEVIRYKGFSAQAFFSSSEPNSSIVTQVLVFASEGAEHAPPTSAWRPCPLTLSIVMYDASTGTDLMVAFSETWLSEGSLRVDHRLNSASLKANGVEAFDYVSGNFYSLDIALTWTGVGELTRESNHSHWWYPGLTVNARFRGVVRPAVASGSVSNGAISFTAQTSESADDQTFIASTQVAEIDVNK